MSTPVVHSVRFHTHDEVLVSRLHNIIVSSLENTVLIVATKKYRSQLEAALVESDEKVQNWAAERLQMFDAQQILEKFMVGGHPSDRPFLRTG
jgi:hypothetical protein